MYLDEDFIDDDNLSLDAFLKIPDIDNKINNTYEYKSDVQEKVKYSIITNINDIDLKWIISKCIIKNKNDECLFFYYNWIKIWAIEYWVDETSGDTIILDYIWNLNSKKSDFEWKLKWLLNWHKKLLWNFNINFYVNWLWNYMITEFIKFSKNKWFKKVKVMIWSDWLKKILNRKAYNLDILNLYTDSDKHTTFDI